MPTFDREIWGAIGKRMQEIRAGVPVNEFLERFELKNSFRWDRVEKGHKGLEFDAFYQICATMDISPAWLLFEKGPRLMKDLPAARDLKTPNAEGVINDVDPNGAPSGGNVVTRKKGAKKASVSALSTRRNAGGSKQGN